MILPIAKLPAKILRTPVEDLSFPLKKENVRLIKNMLDTVISAQGVGLACPQVSKNLNMALIYLDEVEIPPFPIINPKITHYSKETGVMEEGCLSMPGVFGNVRRPKKITMEAYDIDGQKFTITDDTFLARVLQHEIDHLNNVLIFDKLETITKGEDILPNYAAKR
mgnify:FL=1